jgi:hypothetical protein
MDEIKVTWRFAWSLYWRMLLMGLGIAFLVWVIMLIVVTVIGGAFCPFL